MAWAEVNSVGLRYCLEGHGRSVVMVHELGGSLESWDQVVALLEPVNRILRLDLRGAGASEKPRSAFGIQDQANDLAALIESSDLPPPWHLVGAAAGNAPIFALAEQARDHIASIVACCPAITADETRRGYLRDRAALAERCGMRAVVDSALAASWPLDIGGDRAAYRARLLGADPVGYAHANRAVADMTIDTSLAALRTRCVLLAGARDLLRPPALVEALARKIKDAQFGVFDDCGHLMALQAPHKLAQRLTEIWSEAA